MRVRDAHKYARQPHQICQIQHLPHVQIFGKLDTNSPTEIQFQIHVPLIESCPSTPS